MIQTRKIVVDASVAVKWYVPEAGGETAAAILERDAVLLAPDLLAAEFGNVLWKKVNMGELQPSEAEEIVAAFISDAPIDLLPSSHFLRSAFEIAVQFKRTVYDSLYLAVALAEGCQLVTADERLGRSLMGTALEKTIVRPGDL